MSTIDRSRPVTLPPLVAGERLDRATFHARYEAMPPQTRAELIGGVVHMPSPLSRDHGVMSLPIAGWLFHYQRFTPGVLGAENASILLGDGAEPQPDAVLLILPDFGGRARLENGYIAGPPELVVEISRSSRSIELAAKFQDYERAGVLEYLVITSDPDEAHWFIRRDDRLARRSPEPDGRLRSEAFPGLRLDPGALFARDLNGLIAALDQGLASEEHAAFVALLSERGAR